jgi:hypothetical protein
MLIIRGMPFPSNAEVVCLRRLDALHVTIHITVAPRAFQRT